MGVAVILGAVGRNFGAGMSGGIAYVYDPKKTFVNKCNKEGLNLDPLSDEAHVLELKSLIENHYNNTLSPLAQRILEQWETSVQQFVRVLPEVIQTSINKIRRRQPRKKIILWERPQVLWNTNV